MVSIDNNPFSVLDVGAGTGILSLMLHNEVLQQIDAISDEDAYEQCVENLKLALERSIILFSCRIRMSLLKNQKMNMIL
jgi:tRNA1(Val) A37 N6-methylase TrmN6